MKHKLTVLACVSMALLLSTSLAFAQSGVDQGGLQSQTLPRCAQVDIPIFLNHAGFDLGAWGLPLVLTGGGTIDAIAPGADQPGGLTIGTGVSGNAGVANFVGCVPAGNYPSFWVVTITTPDDCVAHLELDTAFYPPAGAWVTLDCNACPVSLSWSKGEWDLVNEDPFCGTNPDLSTEWNGSLSEQLDASDPDACDVASLSYSLVDADGLTGATVSASGLFEYTASCDDKGVHTVVFEVEDQCGATVQCDFDVTVTNAVVPSCGVNTNVSIHHSASVVDKQLNINDAVSYSLVSVVPPFNGGASVSVSASGLFNLSGTDCSDVGAHTINFRGTDGCDSIDCSFQVTITSNPPVCNVSGAHQVNWLGTLDKALTTAFVDCGPVTWSIVDEDPDPTNPGSINGDSYHFDADCADLGTTYTITVRATDATGKTDDCEFTIEVINPDPTITCPPNIPVAILGDLIEADANATDAYGDPLTFSLVSFEHLEDPGRVPHNAPSVDPSSGEFSWQTESSDNNDEGLWEVCLEVADGCGGSDQCCFTIDVLAFTLCAGDSGEVTDSIINAFNGEIVEVHVKIADGSARRSRSAVVLRSDGSVLPGCRSRRQPGRMGILHLASQPAVELPGRLPDRICPRRGDCRPGQRTDASSGSVGVLPRRRDHRAALPGHIRPQLHRVLSLGGLLHVRVRRQCALEQVGRHDIPADRVGYLVHRSGQDAPARHHQHLQRSCLYSGAAG
jgi:hypothetical protein